MLQVNPNGSATQMQEKNPVLPKGVIGIAFGATPADTVIKVGNGATPWNSLPKYGDCNPVVTDITALTAAQLDALKPGHVVVKQTGNSLHAYFVAYKDEELGEIALVYTDRWTIEEVYYEKSEGVWGYVQTDTYNPPVAQAAAASEQEPAPETPAEGGENTGGGDIPETNEPAGE